MCSVPLLPLSRRRRSRERSYDVMKGFGRALGLNCVFLVVVIILVTLQLVLHRRQEEVVLQLWERGEEGEAGEEPPQAAPLQDDPNHPRQNIHPAGDANVLTDDDGGGDVVLAAPVVPNIHRSFPKRKAPYVRKAKKNKKNKKNRKGKQQKGDTRGGGGRGKGGGEKSSKKHDKKGKTKVKDKTKT
ncbi:hypothetical protein GWK47_047501 [Chionoecetes opilio]|uniref:Uncharacterized protein n=1 Tax=Chionoecetes opilio TaxID=41210 RepID=A0A8J5CG88_CHIOP|nr:hypothetical protein GWK47_047501 [Chionoecetes opilio]